jgi:hypothetical protein
VSGREGGEEGREELTIGAPSRWPGLHRMYIVVGSCGVRSAVRHVSLVQGMNMPRSCEPSGWGSAVASGRRRRASFMLLGA